MPTLWAQTADYDNISTGDDLPILVKFEFRPPARPGADAIEEEPVGLEKLTAYVRELLLKAFPPEIVDGENTRIEAAIHTPFLPGDTVSLSGRVLAKSEQDGGRTVVCQVVVEAQNGESLEGQVLAEAKALVSF
ncbi:MAG: hypothetical protein O3A93_10215 [Chloroflexi bacterium]|nr:hypothetical protein [Chloroflexota bacterium]MDA1271617.1 hypothetical protein [Chloroflexota bacterium]